MAKQYWLWCDPIQHRPTIMWLDTYSPTHTHSVLQVVWKVVRTV